MNCQGGCRGYGWSEQDDCICHSVDVGDPPFREIGGNNKPFREIGGNNKTETEFKLQAQDSPKILIDFLTGVLGRPSPPTSSSDTVFANIGVRTGPSDWPKLSGLSAHHLLRRFLQRLYGALA